MTSEPFGPGAGPYRSALAVTAPCPSCGSELSGDARACGACGFEPSAVRCGNCFSLVASGGQSCTHCGATLAPEPELEPRGELCPRCGGGLFTLETGEARLLECKRCGGSFVGHEALASIVAAHRGAVPRVSGVPTPDRPVAYLPCPECRGRMNRAVFGRKSGVIVDVCKVHGTWFDARELTAVIAFVEHGGIERAKKQELLEREQARRRARIERRTEAMRASISAPARTNLERWIDPAPYGHDEGVVDLLDVLFNL